MIKESSVPGIKSIQILLLYYTVLLYYYFKRQNVPENMITDLEVARLGPLIPYYVTKELNNVRVTVALLVLLFGICM